MSISANNMMLNMQITIKELNDKHQLNPINTGVNQIDQCMCYINDSLGICAITGIFIFSEEFLYKIQWENNYALVPANTRILKSDGSFGSIEEGTLSAADPIMILTNTAKESPRIIEITPTKTRTLTYKIKTAKGNYILSNGIIVQAD